MITANPVSAAARGDAELVRESLADDREAFGQIVARYQSLICSLAYSATGNLSRSEDLAQETFVAAWQQLPELREPVRLRAWLCGIARNLISNAQRRAGREPVQLAGPLDPAHEAVAAEPSPPEQAISREEEAILWRALGQIPEGYREPLVLFYREHQSVARVAAALDLSEDAVKQRLSRGRVLLQERVLAFVEGTLERSNPGRTFTLGVLAALPALGTAAKATAAGAAAKTASSAGGAAAMFGAILSFVALLGGLVGYQMSDHRAQSPGERAWVGRFWRMVVAGLGLFVLPAFVLAIFWGRLHPWLLPMVVRWLGLFYAVVAVPLAVWAWRNHRRIRGRPTAPDPAAPPVEKSYLVWVMVATFIMGGLLVFGLFDTNWRVRRISPAEARNIITNQPEAEFSIHQYQSGAKRLWIVQQNRDERIKSEAPLDEATAAVLTRSGVPCPTYVQGRDFEILGWPGKLLFLLAIFVLAAGAVVLVRAAKERRGKAPAMRSPATPAIR